MAQSKNSTSNPPAQTEANSQPPRNGVHDAQHQTKLLREALQSDKVRLGFFLGAGCPLGVYDADGINSMKLIPDVAGLTQMVCDKLSEADTDRTTKLAPAWETICGSCTVDGAPKPNVEHLLTEIRTLCARKGSTAVDGLTRDHLELLDNAICDHITEFVGQPLPPHRCAYQRFASWVGGLQRIAPVELFTPNYDLLLEEAFEQLRIPHFDGFVGSREPFFDLASIEQDSIPPRWTRLWKLHGSINWQKRDDGGVHRVAGTAAKAMIYPSHLKYDQSRRMPYLAMLDRLKAFFRASAHSHGHGPPVLIICGYSFCDEHLNEVILDGLRGNRAAHCFVLAYNALGDSRQAVELAVRQPNMSILAWDGAVIGMREDTYRYPTTPVRHEDTWLMTNSHQTEGDGESIEQMLCRLGDFHYFCLFLEHLCGGVQDDQSATIA